MKSLGTIITVILTLFIFVLTTESAVHPHARIRIFNPFSLTQEIELEDDAVADTGT